MRIRTSRIVSCLALVSLTIPDVHAWDVCKCSAGQKFAKLCDEGEDPSCSGCEDCPPDHWSESYCPQTCHQGPPPPPALSVDTVANAWCCPANTWDDDGTGDMPHCVSCPANYTSPECSYRLQHCVSVQPPHHSASTPPADCGPGFTGSAGSCMPCTASTYKPSTGSDACTTCPSNSHHALQAQASASACVCDPGYTMSGISCVVAANENTMSVYTNSGSSEHYTEIITVVCILCMTVTSISLF